MSGGAAHPIVEPQDAAAYLRRFVENGVADADAQELIRLSDLAASRITDETFRAKVADALIEALTVLKFGGLFGADMAPAKQQALATLGLIERSPSPTAPEA